MWREEHHSKFNSIRMLFDGEMSHRNAIKHDNRIRAYPKLRGGVRTLNYLNPTTKLLDSPMETSFVKPKAKFAVRLSGGSQFAFHTC